MARLIALLSVALIVACGGVATSPDPTPPQAPEAIASAQRSPTADSGAGAFTVVGERSKVSVRVREQLAIVPAPQDAVLSTASISGIIRLGADGGVLPGSTFVVDLSTLRSDESRRDSFVKANTLETRRFPTATFAATKVSGLPRPLPTSGTWQFDLTGNLSIHGVEREVTWNATVTRAPAMSSAVRPRSPCASRTSACSHRARPWCCPCKMRSASKIRVTAARSS